MSNDLFDSSSTEPGDPLKAAADAAIHDVTELQGKLEKARKLQRLLGDLVRYRDNAWPLHIKAACDRECDFLKRLREQSHPAIAPIETLYRDAKVESENAIQELPGQIDCLAKAEGLLLDRLQSRHPRYLFQEDGFIEVRIDDNKRMARISTREVRLADIPADAGAITGTVKTEAERLFGRRFSGSRLLASLRAAYLAMVKTKKLRDGDPIPIREVFAQMAKKTKNYKKDEFLVDLSKLVNEGPAETKDYRFELQQTKDTTEGMLLLGPAGRGMINLLVFKKSNSSAS